jgi:hypothetical protein
MPFRRGEGPAIWRQATLFHRGALTNSPYGLAIVGQTSLFDKKQMAHAWKEFAEPALAQTSEASVGSKDQHFVGGQRDFELFAIALTRNRQIVPNAISVERIRIRWFPR